jgi:hypothetical protein
MPDTSTIQPRIVDISTLQDAATANGAGKVVQALGYDGSQVLFISNGTGTATLTMQGSLDSTFAVSQDTVVIGLVKLWDSTAGTNTSRSIVSGVLTIAASTSYLYQIVDPLPYLRAVISSAASLAGLTAKLYEMAT